jgi:ABC-type multidrug transport system fused ATPase/permease subunit
VNTTAFRRLWSDFVKAPTEKWVAAVGSVAAVIAYVALLILLYLFVDLLVWKGHIPSYAQLPAAKKQEFAAEWGGRPETDRTDSVKRLGLPDPTARRVATAETTPPVSGDATQALDAAEWEARWRAGVYLALRDRVSQSAADTFLPENPQQAASNPDAPLQLGVLTLVVRERDRWTGHALGWVAAWNPWTWRPGVDGTANRTYLAGLFILAFGVALFRGVVLNATAYFAASATLEAVTRLRRAIYFHIYRLGSLAVRTSGPAEAAGLVHRQVEAAGEAVEASFTAPYRHPLKFVLLLALILLVHFWLAVSFVMLALLVWVIGGQVAAYFRREARIGSRQAEAALVLLQESMGLLRLVKCFQMERFNQTRVERQLAESGRASWRRLRGDALARPMLIAVALLAGVALLYLAARSVLAGGFSVAGMAVMAVALVSMVPPLAGWLNYRRRLRRGQEAAAAILEFLDRKGEAAEAADAEFLPALTSRIEFRAVSLKEPGTGRMLLENVTFAVPAGSKVAVVGSDPTAKHALVYLLPRFLDPTAGEIRIEDKNIKWVTHESLRAQVAVVMQDDLVFSDTVANNIGCGDPGYSLPQIIEAAKVAHAHQFIERLPYGYETRVGEQGHALEPGQRFRIALARALLRDPSILVLEEPVGPVDEDTLALLDDTLERVGHGRTIIFLAHRLSTLRGVNRVFLLRDGHLEASGNHRDLWQTNDLYRRLQILADATLETAAVTGRE